MTEEREFMNRWSQRKADARKGALAEEAEVEVASLPPEAEEPTADEAAPELGEDGEPLDLSIPEELRGIDIDALDYDADFSVFLKAGVPEAMRKKALRRLWRSNPVLACLDGLNDYEEDFTDAACAVDGLQSAYRIGKGYFFAEKETVEGEEAEVAEAETETEAEAEAEAEVDADDIEAATETTGDEGEPEAAEVAAGEVDQDSDGLAETEDFAEVEADSEDSDSDARA